MFYNGPMDLKVFLVYKLMLLNKIRNKPVFNYDGGYLGPFYFWIGE